MKSRDEMKRILISLCAAGNIVGVQGLLNTGDVDSNCRGELGYTPLYAAAANTDIEELLIMHGADVNARVRGKTHLMLLIECRQDYSVELLIRQGADINAQDDTGWTALHFAALHGQRKTVEMLLERKADCTLESSTGRTAASYTRDQGIKDLLNKKIKEQNLNMAKRKVSSLHF